jgi:hypothetical protein
MGDLFKNETLSSNEVLFRDLRECHIYFNNYLSDMVVFF